MGFGATVRFLGTGIWAPRVAWGWGRWTPGRWSQIPSPRGKAKSMCCPCPYHGYPEEGPLGSCPGTQSKLWTRGQMPEGPQLPRGTAAIPGSHLSQHRGRQPPGQKGGMSTTEEWASMRGDLQPTCGVTALTQD